MPYHIKFFSRKSFYVEPDPPQLLASPFQPGLENVLASFCFNITSTTEAIKTHTLSQSYKLIVTQIEFRIGLWNFPRTSPPITEKNHQHPSHYCVPGLWGAVLT